MFLVVFVAWLALGAFLLNRPTVNVFWAAGWIVMFFFWVRAARFPCPKCGSRLGYTNNACRNCGISFDEPYPVGHDKSTSQK